MEIITVLKANIRHRKGSFVSIILLMAIISMALVSIFSVWDNISGGIEDAHQRADTSNVQCMIMKYKLTDSMYSDVANHPLVRKVKEEDEIELQSLVYCGEKYSNSVRAVEMDGERRRFNASGTGFLEETPELKPGEVYISRGMQTNLSCKVGEILTFEMSSASHDFKIAGIVEDALFGASVIGWKNIFIGHEDFERLYREEEQVKKPLLVKKLSIYKKDNCELSDAKFMREINLDTGFIDMCVASSTKEMLTNYTFLFPKIICIILVVFVLLLTAAIVVIMCHSVSTGIEMEYTTFGVMKSQGFTAGKIQVILAAQYLLAQLCGIILGTVASVPLCNVLADIFHPITGIVPRRAISAGKSGSILLGVLVISLLCILIISSKIAEIKPMRAIAGGRRDIYFDSRMNVAVRKKMLSLCLAFRQFTSNKKQYVGVIIIVALLTYFMTSMMILTNAVSATSAWESMGMAYSNIDLSFEEEAKEEQLEGIEKIIRKYSSFETAYKSCNNYYFSVNGEQIMLCMYDGAEYILGITKGRSPKYDNEIVMTEIAADNLGLAVGDKVTVGYAGKKAEYIICGLNQYMNDAGVNFSMTKDAVQKLYDVKLCYVGYRIDDISKGNKIVEEINRKYSSVLAAEFDEDPMDESYEIAVNAMTLVVYIFSVIFVVVVVHMVCSKVFLRERKDIGIYKAVGFTAVRLRLQFAVRFVIVAAVGAVFGGASAAAFAGKMLSAILRLIGISSVHVTFYVTTFAVPILLICVCFFLFAYVASRRINRVEVRELISE